MGQREDVAAVEGGDGRDLGAGFHEREVLTDQRDLVRRRDDLGERRQGARDGAGGRQERRHHALRLDREGVLVAAPGDLGELGDLGADRLGEGAGERHRIVGRRDREVEVEAPISERQPDQVAGPGGAEPAVGAAESHGHVGPGVHVHREPSPALQGQRPAGQDLHREEVGPADDVLPGDLALRQTVGERQALQQPDEVCGAVAWQPDDPFLTVECVQELVGALLTRIEAQRPDELVLLQRAPQREGAQRGVGERVTGGGQHASESRRAASSRLLWSPHRGEPGRRVCGCAVMRPKHARSRL